MRRIKCFMIEPAMIARCSLRRYVFSNKDTCNHPGQKYHHAMVQIEDDTLVIETSPSGYKGYMPSRGLQHDHSDPRWPTHCACGYAFQEEDEWQLFYEPLYRRVENDTGELWPILEAPAGAMWYDLQDNHKLFVGSDGRRLNVMTPGGDWCIDWRASNCTLPQDSEHRCWVRHGVPPEVTVDKNGLTCAAGAGSIVRGSYHGFLRNGYLED